MAETLWHRHRPGSGRSWLQLPLPWGLCLLLCLMPQSEAAPSPRKGERIVGGTAAPIGRYPYQVMLLADGSFHCGGALILDRVVLTAAHCMSGWETSSMTVHLGKYYRDEVPPETRGVEKAVVHSQYNSGNIDNDIALLYLDKAAPANMTTIRLPAATQVPTAGQAVRMTGWGALYEGGPTSDKLMQVDVKVVSKTVCNSGTSYNGAITASMLCAGPMEGGKDTCQGDSGGPLFVAGKDARGKDDVHYGITSWGSGCAQAKKPGVYTSTVYMRTWINDQLKAWGYKATDLCPVCSGDRCQQCTNPLLGCVAVNEGGICKPAAGEVGKCQSGDCIATCPEICGPCKQCTDPVAGCVPANQGKSCTSGFGTVGTCSSAGSCLSTGSEIDLVGKVAAQASNRTTTPGFDASRAINGNFNDVSSTRVQTNPWWWVDLGSSQAVASVTIFLKTENGTYCYTSSTAKNVQVARFETLRITLGDINPTPTTATGDIRNTVVFESSVDLSAQAVVASFATVGGNASHLGRYVALQIRGANKYLDMVEVRVNMDPAALKKTSKMLMSWF